MFLGPCGQVRASLEGVDVLLHGPYGHFRTDSGKYLRGPYGLGHHSSRG